MIFGLKRAFLGVEWKSVPDVIRALAETHVELFFALPEGEEFYRSALYSFATRIGVNMVSVKKIVLDVLKPHRPNGLEFASTIAEKSPGCRVSLAVSEVDEKTETVVLVVEGQDLQYDAITEIVSSMGGSVHSIDEVVVESGPDENATK